MDARLHMGSVMLVSGPIWSGKTSFVIRLLDSAHVVFDVKPTFVYWFYGQKTAQHDLLTRKNYIMHEGLPTNFDFCERNSVIVLDDLMEETKDSVPVTALYTKGAHHTPYFVINILQNLYFQSKQQRTRHLNTQYMALFKNPRDLQQINVLSRQMYPNKKNYLVEIYQDAVAKEYGYLFIDLHTRTSELIKLRSDILPLDPPMYAYVDKQLYGKTLPMIAQQPYQYGGE